jgi:hypothetical protein
LEVDIILTTNNKMETSMPRAEEEFLMSVPQTLLSILRQLEIANKLKALEIKQSICPNVSEGMVDAVFDE